jgi:hypothetical protein
MVLRPSLIVQAPGCNEHAGIRRIRNVQDVKVTDMSNNVRGIKLTVRVMSIVIALAVGGMGTAAAAGGNPDNFGHAVYMCADMMLPYDIDSRGAITMIMPDGSTMHWRNFGEMVIHMRTHQMCS